MGLENCGHTWKMDVVTNRIKLLGLFGMNDIVQKHLGIYRLTLVFHGQMKMWSGGSTRGTSNGDWSTCLDMATLWNEDVREMAVADGIVTMTKSNEIARTFIIADAFYNTIKYGITRFIVGTQVNTVMKLSLGSEWIIAIAIW